MRAIKISSQKDFEFYLTEIKSKHIHQQLVFRGQVKDYPLVPSMRRGRGKNPSPGCIPWLTANWDVCARRLVSRFKKSQPAFAEAQAVMQHYGYRSFFVDVTSNPEVALWFALHQFRSENTPLHVDSQLRSAVFQWSQYALCRTGFLYVLSVPNDNSKNQYVNLIDTMPSSAARIHRQNAGAIFCSSKLESIDDCIIAKLEVIDDDWFRNSKRNLKFTELFPPPSIDIFYRSLCTTPYFISLETAMNNIGVGHPLLGPFPIYVESLKELIKEYLPLTKILSSARLAPQWNIATAVADLENQRFKARAATRISFSSLMIRTISEDIPETYDFQTNPWPSRSLLLEFEPEASLVSPSTEALHDVVRGLWVIIGTRSIFVATIIDVFDDVYVGHECVYSLPELNLISKKCNCTEHAYELAILRNASHLIDEGIIHIVKDYADYSRLEAKDED